MTQMTNVRIFFPLLNRKKKRSSPVLESCNNNLQSGIKIWDLRKALSFGKCWGGTTPYTSLQSWSSRAGWVTQFGIYRQLWYARTQRHENVTICQMAYDLKKKKKGSVYKAVWAYDRVTCITTPNSWARISQRKVKLSLWSCHDFDCETFFFVDEDTGIRRHFHVELSSLRWKCCRNAAAAFLHRHKWILFILSTLLCRLNK